MPKVSKSARRKHRVKPYNIPLHKLKYLDYGRWLHRSAKHHPATIECPEAECVVCAYRDCPYGSYTHYDKDGCTWCFFDAKNNDYVIL